MRDERFDMGKQTSGVEVNYPRLTRHASSEKHLLVLCSITNDIKMTC